MTLRPCLFPGCSGLSHRTYCKKHERPAWKKPGRPGAYGPVYRANRKELLQPKPPCHWCGKPATTADHLKAVADGGSDALENLVPACKACNEKRGARLGRSRRRG